MGPLRDLSLCPGLLPQLDATGIPQSTSRSRPAPSGLGTQRKSTDSKREKQETSLGKGAKHRGGGKERPRGQGGGMF